MVFAGSHASTASGRNFESPKRRPVMLDTPLENMTTHPITLNLNQQQLELMDRTIARGAAPDREALIRKALKEYAQGQSKSQKNSQQVALDLDSLSDQRELLFEHIIDPGTGKALEVMKGQMLRVEQLEGGQCVDFNCFNLHDYKEFMHTGRTRTVHGILPTTGHFLWSAPPRERAMMYLLDDTVACNDVMFPRCSANLYESIYGLPVHTNCHDIQAEAQREYGLTPDDVHDSFNLFMCTEVHSGRGHIKRQHSKPGDYVDLLALMDVLAVPNVCGADIMRTSNFSLKPILLKIFQASPRDIASVPTVTSYPSQRTPADFKLPNIRLERALRRDPNYQAKFTNVPILIQPITLSLDDEEHRFLQGLGLQEIYGDDEGAMLRDALFSWWETQYL
jgi:uncharacterized protein